MQLEITQETAEAVRSKVESGLYPNAEAVIVAALRLLDDAEAHRQQKLANLRREVQIGLDAVERGDYETYDQDSLKAFFEELKQQMVTAGSAS